MESELKIINALKNHYGSEYKLSAPYENNYQKYSLFSALFMFVLFTLSLVVLGKSTISAILFLLATLTLAIYQVSTITPTIKNFIRPTWAHLNLLSKKLPKEAALIQELAKSDSEIIARTQERLKLEVTTIQSRIGLIMGSLGKLGLLPAIGVMYAAYTQVLSIALPYKLDVALMALVVGAYLGSASVKATTIRIEAMIYFLRQAQLLKGNANKT